MHKHRHEHAPNCTCGCHEAQLPTPSTPEKHAEDGCQQAEGHAQHGLQGKDDSTGEEGEGETHSSAGACACGHEHSHEGQAGSSLTLIAWLWP